MPFIPSRVKYRKAQRGRRKGLAVAGSRVSFGEYGLRALEPAWLKNNQLETIRVALSRALRREGKYWLRVFSDKPISKKPQETRMGKGKGDIAFWVAIIRRGQVVFEIGGVPREYAQEVCRNIAHKLSFRTMFVERAHL